LAQAVSVQSVRVGVPGRNFCSPQTVEAKWHGNDTAAPNAGKSLENWIEKKLIKIARERV
jgi:hypothetical protein